MTILGTNQIKPDSVRRAEPSVAKAGRQARESVRIILTSVALSNISGSGFGTSANSGVWRSRQERFILVFPRALLRSPSMARRPRGPYQVIGENRYGGG